MEVDGGVASAARRRRERRLRSWWKQEQQTVRMALSAAAHHSFDKVAAGEKHNALRGQKTDRARREVEERELHDAPRRQKPPPLGTRPPPLAEVQPQGAVVQHRGICFELVQALDVPVLQMVEQPVDVDSFFRISVPAVDEQVIEVPKLALPVRAVQRAALSEPQLVEQLVEVPTVLSYSLLQQRTAEQIFDIPVPVVLEEGGVEVFTASPRDRAQQRFVELNTLTLPFLTVVLEGEVFKVFPEDRVPQRLPLSRPSVLIVKKTSRFFPVDSSTASAVEQTFSQAPRRSMPRVPVHGRHDEWVCVVDVENDGEYFWNRMDNSSCWRLPRGVKHRWCLLPSGLHRDVVLQVDYRVLPPL